MITLDLFDSDEWGLMVRDLSDRMGADPEDVDAAARVLYEQNPRLTVEEVRKAMENVVS